jgi:hypothetical protein
MRASRQFSEGRDRDDDDPACNGDAVDYMAGFRHFLPEDFGPDNAFKIDGKSPHGDTGGVERLRQLMARLAKRMDFDFDWPGGAVEQGLEAWENPEIPSGYTYLLQLVAHDIVSTSLSIAVLEGATTGLRNARSGALRLDTIYDGGPAVCPIAYQPDDAGGISRTALRLGPMKNAPGLLRDLARMPPPCSDAIVRDGLTEVAVADPRNDDHAIIAQLTVLFHLAHNSILKLLPAAAEGPAADSVLEAEYKRFLCARGALTLIYRQIIRNDLLEKILHPAVYAFYSKQSAGFEFLDKGASGLAGDARIPVEFSHAAFRFGHAMARPKYQFNDQARGEFFLSDVLLRNSVQSPDAMPQERNWIIRWSRFFKFKDELSPNLSRRIGPQFLPDYMKPELFPQIDHTGRAGLAYRDLLAGGILDVWSVPKLIEIVEHRRTELFRQSSLLSGAGYREALGDYLRAHNDVVNFSDADIRALVDDPPLAFFVLWEAATDPKTRGLKLGLLGSVIVAEVMYAALTRDPVLGEADHDDIDDALTELARRSFGDQPTGMDALKGIDTMEKLIRFVAENNVPGNTDPSFI